MIKLEFCGTRWVQSAVIRTRSLFLFLFIGIVMSDMQWCNIWSLDVNLRLQDVMWSVVRRTDEAECKMIVRATFAATNYRSKATINRIKLPSYERCLKHFRELFVTQFSRVTCCSVKREAQYYLAPINFPLDVRHRVSHHICKQSSPSSLAARKFWHTFILHVNI